MPPEAGAPGTALLASAGGERVSVIRGLEPAWPGAHVLGRAFTVAGAPADNLALHHALTEAGPDEVIVADVGGEQETAHCGDIVVRAARQRGIRGIVLNGSIRDRAAIAELAYPVFHAGTSPRGPAKRVAGRLGVTIELLGTPVHPGDLVCADDDGVVVVAAAHAADVLAAAAALEAREREIERRLDGGETTLDILGLPERR